MPFDSWDLTPAPLPPRSRLHSIPPIGIGTPLVESLTGYMIRLAASHAVRVSDLIEHELRTGVSYYHPPAGIRNAINSVGESARNWVGAVEWFTLRDNLRFLTLSPLAAVLNDVNLMRRERAWCPRCYESSVAQEIYEQLIWCLRCVEVCPLHKVPLETACPACHRQLRPLCAVSRPGLCSRCHRWLGTACGASAEAPGTDYQVWVAEQVGQLLTIAPDASPAGKENIRRVLTHYAEAYSEGNRAAAAETAGCSRSSFYNWCNGTTIARIDLLLRMCYQLGITLSGLVTGSTVPPADTAGVRRVIEARRLRGIVPQRSADRIRAALVLATKEHPPPSIGEVAERLGYSTPTRLYVADGDLCKAIVRNFHKSGRNHWWRRRGAKRLDDSILRKALEQSLALEMPLPIHRSAAAFGYWAADALITRFPDLCRAINAKRAQARARRRSAVLIELEAALREDPPPTLKEVAHRLGYVSGTAIRAVEPHLCAKLLARRRAIVEDARRELRRQLEAVLQEDPPPSLRQAHVRFGIKPESTYCHFPELCRAIAARHRGFRRRHTASASFGAKRDGSE